MTGLEQLQALMRGEAPSTPVAELVGFRLTAVEPGRALMVLDAGTRHATLLGTVHGGIIGALADAAMAMAYASTLGEGETFTTLEFKINFLRPVWQARLTAEGRLVQGGRTVGLTECAIRDDRGRLVAQATGTCMTLRGDQAAGRRPQISAGSGGEGGDA
ncbi:MAG TPA: PaaI family thioesterase [Dehalococcoidia bacterium]